MQPTATWVVNVRGRKARQGAYKRLPLQAVVRTQNTYTKTTYEKTAIERQIDATDRQIDTLVYELYGLTEEEINIVESNQ
jgi:peptidoglycan hydrolase CwlO-like protein